MDKFTIFLLLSISLSSCTKQISIIFPQQTPKLVVNSIFTNDKVIMVNLSQTIEYNSTKKIKITNAECKLFCNDEFIEVLENHKNGLYTSSIIPETGKNYKISISCDGFESVSANSYIPEYPNEFKYNTIPSVIFDPDDGLGVFYTNASIYIEDITTQNNFYQLKLNLKIKGNSPLSYSEIHRYRSDDPIIVSEGIQAYQPNILLFSDKLINGQNSTINFQHAFPETFDDTVLLIIETKSLTQDYFNYLKSSIIQTNHQSSTNNILAIGEPIEIYTNIKNGYGIFSGVNIHYDTIILNGWNTF
ncbi:MAG: DUF4249 domain-containing protein [Bacteroidota bacterium]|nr:DUF4249 domain-containing protein [Bacteroidota bacterium]